MTVDSSYEIIVAPAALPLDLALVKEHLRLDPADVSQDAYLTLLIEAVRNFSEKYTKRTLINTTYRTYRNCFSGKIELRRSKLQSLVEFKYSVDDVMTDVDSSLYYTTQEKDYSKILLKSAKSYPTDADDKVQAILADFVAGFGADESAIPADLKIALLNHVAVLYENRGDCDLASVVDNLPNTSRIIYDQWRILDLIGEIDYSTIY